jgi:glycosyltransferase involved in cell wall biosynthesis
MKVVYFIDNLRGDGTQRVLSQLARKLAERGYKQTVVCLNDSCDEWIVANLRKAPVEVRIVGKAALASGYGLLSTLLWLRREKFDIAVTLLFVADVVGRMLARLAGVDRIISSLRARNVHYSPLQRRLVRATMGSADAVVINSSYLREFAIVEEGARPERIHVIPNGVYIENYSTPIDQGLLRANMGLPRSTLLIGSVGRLTRQKGFDVLLRAFSLLSREDVNLLIFGIGEEEARLRALASKSGLQERIHFAGYRRDLPSLLGALDLYVHPARFEGMPNALLEAMAAARPIIASNTDGNRELIEDGIHGWLVPPDDPGALAKATEDALTNLDEAQRRGAAARQRVATHFGVEAMVGAWEKLLMERR